MGAVTQAVSKADVVQMLARGRSLATGSAPWTLRFIEQADAQFGGRWRTGTISSEEALEVVLPPHSGEPCQGDSLPLVGSRGATVRETADHLARIREDYARANTSCWSRLAESTGAPFSPVILTTAPLLIDDYRTVAPRPGGLYLLDGFHRLVAWAGAGRLKPGVELRVVIGG